MPGASPHVAASQSMVAVSSTHREQKQYYDMAQEMTLEYCYDLNMLTINQERMYMFYTQHGILNGVAWNYVCGIKSFLRENEGLRTNSI